MHNEKAKHHMKKAAEHHKMAEKHMHMAKKNDGKKHEEKKKERIK